MAIKGAIPPIDLAHESICGATRQLLDDKLAEEPRVDVEACHERLDVELVAL